MRPGTTCPDARRDAAHRSPVVRPDRAARRRPLRLRDGRDRCGRRGPPLRRDPALAARRHRGRDQRGLGGARRSGGARAGQGAGGRRPARCEAVGRPDRPLARGPTIDLGHGPRHTAGPARPPPTRRHRACTRACARCHRAAAPTEPRRHGHHRPDGAPRSVATWYLWDEGRILLSLDARRTRLDDLRRDPRMSLTVLDGKDWYGHVSIRAPSRSRTTRSWRPSTGWRSTTCGRPYPDRRRPRVTAWMTVERVHTWRR